MQRILLLLASVALFTGSASAAGQAADPPGRTLEFRYVAPEAGEVFLVWGIDGWKTVPEKDRPPGTTLIKRVMRTPMTRDGDVFLIRLRVDPDAAVDYGFLTTRTRDGVELDLRPAWDGRKEFHVPPGGLPAVLETRSLLDLSHSPDASTLSFAAFYFLSAAGAAFLINALVRKARPGTRRLVTAVALTVIVAAGMGLRIGAAIHWNQDRPDCPERLIGDEPGYDSMARQLLDGHGFTWPGRVPLYPAWLAGVYRLSGGSCRAVPYFQAVLGLATILLTFSLGRSLFGDRAGLLAAGWASASYVLVLQPLHLLSEILYTPVLLLTALALVNAFREPTRKNALFGGALVGIGNLVRPAMLFFPLFLAALLPIAPEKRKMAKCWLVIAVVSILMVSPWVLHNYVKYRAVFPLQTSNAILWQGSPEYYRLIHDEGYTYMRIWSEILYGPGWQLRDPTSIEGDRYWTGRAVRSILAEPMVYLRFAGEKSITYWLGDPSADWGNRRIFSYGGLRQIGFSPRGAVQILFARFLPIVALAALVFTPSVRSKSVPLLMMMAYFTLLHAFTHAEARLSEPLQPLLLVVIAGAAISAIDRFQAHAPDPA